MLLTVVLESRKSRSFLLVLNPSDLAEKARATLPDTIVPIGLHGLFA